MRAFIESLSIGSGAAVIAALSAVAGCLLGRIRSVGIRWSAAVVLPLVFSYCLYWLPVWLGADRSEYSSWEVLFVGIWFLAGVVASSVAIFIVSRYTRRHA